jgi:hypothetical protein
MIPPSGRIRSGQRGKLNTKSRSLGGIWKLGVVSGIPEVRHSRAAIASCLRREVHTRSVNNSRTRTRSFCDVTPKDRLADVFSYSVCVLHRGATGSLQQWFAASHFSIPKLGWRSLDGRNADCGSRSQSINSASSFIAECPARGSIPLRTP